MTLHELPLGGKLAIVTGASRGIGYEIAYELAKLGANVLGTCSTSSSVHLLEELATKVAKLQNNAKVEICYRDLRDPDAASTIVAAAKRFFKTETVDILVNNAGCEVVKPIADLTAEDFGFVYDLNVRAPLLLIKAVIPFLPSSGGRVINIGSVGAREGFDSLSLYCSSKAALEGLTRVSATELGKKEATSNCVNPGPVQSDMLDNIPKEIVNMQKAQTPMGNRLGTVEDVARIVGLLAEERSQWITGQVISASGGLNMY